MTVYFIRNVDGTGNIKIGYAGDVRGRMSCLKSEHGHEFELLATCEGDVDVERHLHKKLQAHRQNGEFFLPTSDVFAAIAHAKSDPSTFQAAVGREASSETIAILPGDSTGENGVVRLSRYYLNSLVRREWRGMEETASEARNRLADRLQIDRSYAKRLWSRSSDMNDVSGNVYLALHIAFLNASCENPNVSEDDARAAFFYRMRGFNIEETVSVRRKMRRWMKRTGIQVPGYQRNETTGQGPAAPRVGMAPAKDDARTAEAGMTTADQQKPNPTRSKEQT